MAQWIIESITISGGFLSDLSLRLPSGLVCVIGPRGSGKSTLAEALRVTLGGVPVGVPKARQDFIKATLGGAVVSLTTASTPERTGMTVRRVVGHPPVLNWADGRAISAVDLDRGTFLPVDVYSGPEIETIADESVGGRRRALLDDLCSEEMQQIHLTLAEHRRGLDANGDAIASAQRKIAALTEQLEELGDTKAQFDSLPSVPEQAANPEFDAASRQRLWNEQEKKRADTVVGAISLIRERVSTGVGEANAAFARHAVDAASTNHELMGRLAFRLDELNAELVRLLDLLGSVLDRAQSDIRATVNDLSAAHAGQEQEFARLQQLNQQSVQAYAARTAAERSIATANELLRLRQQTEQDLSRLYEARRSLKTDYLLTRDRVSEARERVAAALQANAGSRIRIRVVRNADSLEYQERLSVSLKGSNLRNQGELLHALAQIRPEDLAQILRSNDGGELEAQTGLGKERCRKILDAIRAAEDPLKLEVVATDDKVCIELNVSAAGEEHFKDAAELSRGQKCTALLPILLARRSAPLVIDQPEDNLDNHYIYETVVGTIRRLKPTRQMIFITHNANIPVLGGADLVVVMNSDGRRGYVQKVGTVDECRDEIIDLLEGGAEAFEERRKCYGSE